MPRRQRRVDNIDANSNVDATASSEQSSAFANTSGAASGPQRTTTWSTASRCSRASSASARVISPRGEQQRQPEPKSYTSVYATARSARIGLGESANSSAARCATTATRSFRRAASARSKLTTCDLPAPA